MNRNIKIPIRRFLSKNPFQQSPKPTYPIPIITTKTLSSKRTNTPISNPSSTHFSVSPLQTLRTYSNGNGSSEFDQNKEVDLINLKFAEAREEIEMAMESKETVYFNEEAECARAAVKEVLDLFDSLLAKLSDTERAALQRSMGLKMEQLRAELQQLDE